MTKQEKIDKLKRCFEETIWMAIRYADGRHTYAPEMVRNAVKQFQMVYPEWKPKEDITIKRPKKEDVKGFKLVSDYLYDIF